MRPALLGAALLGAALFGACDLGYQVGPWTDGAAAFLDAGGRRKDGPRPDAPRPLTDSHERMRDGVPAPDAPAPDGPPPCPSSEVTMAMRNLAFEKPHLQVPAGTRVTWVNEDTMIHDITEGDPGNPTPRFASGVLSTGQRWSRDFCAPIRVVYHCAAHPNLMRDATVVVGP